MWNRVWRSTGIVLATVLIMFSIWGIVQAETPPRRVRTPYPAPLPEEILAGRIACDADGNLFVPIAVYCDRVEFRDSTATIIATRPLAKLSTTLLSPRGNYACILTIDPEPTKEGPGACTTTVYDRRGTEVWTRTEPKEFDEVIPGPYLSDRDASVVELAPTVSTLRFRDERGSEVRTVELMPGARYDLEMSATMARSEDGEYVAVLANSDVPIPYGVTSVDRHGNPIAARSGNPQLILLDRTGHELWRRGLEELGSGIRVTISESGAYIIAGSTTGDAQRGIVDSGIYVFARDGSLIGKYAIHTPGGIWSPQFAVSADERLIALANLRRVMVLDAASGVAAWDQTLSSSSPAEGTEVIRDVQFLGQGGGLSITATVLMGEGPHREISQFLVDANGIIVRETRALGTTRSRDDVVVCASPSGDRVGVLTAQGLMTVDR